MDMSKIEKLIMDIKVILEKNEASSYHLKMFGTVTRGLLRYAEKKNVSDFSLELGLEFLDEHYHMSEKRAENKFSIIYLYCINELYDVQQKGFTCCYYGKYKRRYDIPSGFKESNDSYLQHRIKIGICKKSISAVKLYLERFFQFLVKNDVNNPSEIELDSVFAFLKNMDEYYEKTTVSHNMRTVRFYLKYCYDNGLISKDISSHIPNVHYCRQSHLPSVYTAEEVRKLLNSVDCGNPCGKRDYAIVLLIARSGLRSSDIAGLCFSDIDWEKQKITKIMQKTGKTIELPLFNDVGEAIIDYLKNARPESDSNHVFIKNKPPYDELTSGSVGAIVRRLMQRSGIKIKNRKCGSHALRHSLASRLLECDIPMPVISEILGHADTTTTMAYLRIDIAQLRECALEVEV